MIMITLWKIEKNNVVTLKLFGHQKSALFSKDGEIKWAYCSIITCPAHNFHKTFKRIKTSELGMSKLYLRERNIVSSDSEHPRSDRAFCGD